MSVKNMKKSEKGIKIVPIVEDPYKGERILSVSLPKDPSARTRYVPFGLLFRWRGFV